MSQQPDDRSPNAAARQPRGMVRAAVVATINVGAKKELLTYRQSTFSVRYKRSALQTPATATPHQPKFI